MKFKAYLANNIVLENDGGRVVHHVTLVLPKLSAEEVSMLLKQSEHTIGELVISI